MYWRSAAALSLASVGLIEKAYGNLVTITEFPSACSAVYTTGSRSVTVVQSTVTVEPQPWTDSTANNGTAFVLEVEWSAISGSNTKRDPVTAYLTGTGNTTIDGTRATHYQIANGKLTSVDGGFASSSPNIANEPFDLSAGVASISTTFSVVNGALTWKNAAFSNGSAEFFKVPANLLDNAEVIVRFGGAIDQSWTPVVLLAMPGTWYPMACSRQSDLLQ